MYLIEDFFHDYGKELGLQLIVGEEGLKRKFKHPEVHCPGLALAGFLKQFTHHRLLVFGNNELLYLKDLPSSLQQERLEAILTKEVPAIIITGRSQIPKIVISHCVQLRIPLFKTSLPTMEFLSKATFILADIFAPSTSSHGTFIEAFGIGVLIQGDSSIGKSEAALGLIDRGHRLVSDDVVKLRLRKGSVIEGSGPELNKHMMEIRGIGIINVAHLYGAVCVSGSKSLDIIVKLEEWDNDAFYDRIGLDEKFIKILGVNVPYHILPVKPGRDVALLIETIVLNYRLKLMGYHSAREFNIKLLERIAQKSRESIQKS